MRRGFAINWLVVAMLTPELKPERTKKAGPFDHGPVDLSAIYALPGLGVGDKGRRF
jgi:hypothetical protein